MEYSALNILDIQSKTLWNSNIPTTLNMVAYYSLKLNYQFIKTISY